MTARPRTCSRSAPTPTPPALTWPPGLGLFPGRQWRRRRHRADVSDVLCPRRRPGVAAEVGAGWHRGRHGASRLLVPEAVVVRSQVGAREVSPPVHTDL